MTEHRRWPRIVLTWLVFVLAICAFFCADVWQLGKLAPPAGVTTVSEFAKLMPPPKRLAIVEDHGQPTVVWIGEHASFPALPSGPPCYQFDQHGNLIDWCSDSGEGHRLDGIAGRAYQQPRITVEEAIQRTIPPP